MYLMMKQTNYSIVRLLSTVLFLALFNGSLHAHDEVTHPSSDRLIFGIAPFMSPLALVKRMAPLRTYLSDALGVEVLIETTTDAKDFARRTLSGHYDFVLTNPTFSLMAIDKGEFQIVATQKSKLLGYFVVLENSNIKDIKDLAGKRIGAPPKVGFMGQLIDPFLRKNIFSDSDMPEIKYFHSHNDAISALRLGETNATLIVSFMSHHLHAKGHQLRTIFTTEAYPGMTVLANKKMSAELVNKLRMALFALDQKEEGIEVLKKISMSGYQKLDKKELEKVRPYLPPKGIK